MGLVLVFRINSGYDRWWEARKIWGDTVNTVRNFSILIKCYTNCELTNDTLGLISAFPVFMKNHLRSILTTEEVKNTISSKDYIDLQKWENRPIYISLRIAENLSFMSNKGEINQFAFLKAEHMRELLIDAQGACERILKTPMPLVMAIKISRLILLF